MYASVEEYQPSKLFKKLFSQNKDGRISLQTEIMPLTLKLDKIKQLQSDYYGRQKAQSMTINCPKEILDYAFGECENGVFDLSSNSHETISALRRFVRASLTLAEEVRKLKAQSPYYHYEIPDAKSSPILNTVHSILNKLGFLPNKKIIDNKKEHLDSIFSNFQEDYKALELIMSTITKEAYGTYYHQNDPFLSDMIERFSSYKLYEKYYIDRDKLADMLEKLEGTLSQTETNNFDSIVQLYKCMDRKYFRSKFLRLFQDSLHIIPIYLKQSPLSNNHHKYINPNQMSFSDLVDIATSKPPGLSLPHLRECYPICQCESDVRLRYSMSTFPLRYSTHTFSAAEGVFEKAVERVISDPESEKKYPHEIKLLFIYGWCKDDLTPVLNLICRFGEGISLSYFPNPIEDTWSYNNPYYETFPDWYVQAFREDPVNGICLRKLPVSPTDCKGNNLLHTVFLGNDHGKIEKVLQFFKNADNGHYGNSELFTAKNNNGQSPLDILFTLKRFELIENILSLFNRECCYSAIACKKTSQGHELIRMLFMRHKSPQRIEELLTNVVGRNISLLFRQPLRSKSRQTEKQRERHRKGVEFTTHFIHYASTISKTKAFPYIPDLDKYPNAASFLLENNPLPAIKEYHSKYPNLFKRNELKYIEAAARNVDDDVLLYVLPIYLNKDSAGRALARRRLETIKMSPTKLTYASVYFHVLDGTPLYKRINERPSTLIEFNLSGSSVSNLHLERLIKLRKQNVFITSLNLSKTKIDNSSRDLISEIIMAHRLQNLDLSHNMLGVPILKTIRKAANNLSQHQNLHLNLSNCWIRINTVDFLYKRALRKLEATNKHPNQHKLTIDFSGNIIQQNRKYVGSIKSVIQKCKWIYSGRGPMNGHSVIGNAPISTSNWSVSLLSTIPTKKRPYGHAYICIDGFGKDGFRVFLVAELGVDPGISSGHFMSNGRIPTIYDSIAASSNPIEMISNLKKGCIGRRYDKKFVAATIITRNTGAALYMYHNICDEIRNETKYKYLLWASHSDSKDSKRSLQQEKAVNCLTWALGHMRPILPKRFQEGYTFPYSAVIDLSKAIDGKEIPQELEQLRPSIFRFSDSNP